jgi:hypothetical protein
MLARAHLKFRFTKGHTVLALSEVDNTPLSISVICPDHGEPFKLYDTECKRLVCMLDLALEHNGHKCVSIAEAATKDRVDLESHATKAKKGIADMKQAEIGVAQVRQELKHRLEQAEENIESSFDQVRLPSYVSHHS